MRTPKDLTVAVEITDSHIKLVQIKPTREGNVISGVDIRRINGLSEEAVAKSLEEMLSSREIRGEDCVVTVQRRLAVLKNLTLPSRVDAEIGQMVEMQAARNTPYSRDDIIYDFMVLQKDLSSASVLAAVVPTDVIQRYLRIFRSAGTAPAWLTLSSTGIAGWLDYKAGKGRTDLKRPLCFINIDSGHSEICFCHEQKLLFSRQIPFGIDDVRGGRISAFEEQFRLTLEMYRKEKLGPDIARCLVISTLPEAVFIKDDIEREYKIPVEISSSFEDFPCGDEADARDACLPAGQAGLQNECSIAVGLGLLFSGKKRWFNLMPPEVKQGALVRRQQYRWAKFALALVVSVASVSVAFGYEVHSRARYLGQVQAELAKVAPELKEAEKQAGLVHLVEQKSAERIFVADLIKELQQLLPEEMHLYALSVSGGGVVNMQGYAKTGEGVSRLQNDLVRSSFFQNVTLQYATIRKSSNGELTDFKMSCQFVQGTGRKGNEASGK